MMSRLAWAGAGALGALVVLAGSMVHIVPPDATPAPAPVTAVAEPAQPPAPTQPLVPAIIPQQAGQTPEGAPVTLAEHPALTVPVQGIPRDKIVDTWGQARGGGTRPHHGTDIMAAGGAPVIAAADGTVEKLFFSNGGGGISLYERSPDRRWQYYYAHLQAYAPGIHEGQQIHAGELLGFVGDTGNAGTGNFHLHFGMSRMLSGDGWWKGAPINAYPLLAGRDARR
jgi:murein DD-endopeptidase MepM/ murein hydrolase activator NlpD